MLFWSRDWVLPTLDDCTEKLTEEPLSRKGENLPRTLVVRRDLCFMHVAVIST